LPFIPGFYEQVGGDSIFRRFDDTSLSLNATHSNGLREYDVHNLFGLMMAKRTFECLTNTSSSFKVDPTIYPNFDRRPFILSRSTFASSGKYASHSLGDNWSDWSYMNSSIAGIMSMNMFGIPLAGADVCGFFGEKRNDEMCARWI
jgi:alpha-glucosidase